jgi:hypothetical protein
MIELNDGHYLEAMDRMHVAICMIDEHILCHPLVEQHPDIKNKIEEVIDFETYTKKYPESKTEMYSYATDKTQSGGFLRKVSGEKDSEYGGSMVQYGVNLLQPTPRLKQDIDLN